MDTIGEFLTRIRNACKAGHEKVDIPSSNVRQGMADILRDAGYIRNFKVVQDGKQGMMRVYLKYNSTGKPAIESIQRVSRPGCRRYTNAEKIPNVRSGFGLVILSTNKGILSGQQAKEQKVGGEILCSVW